MKRHMRKLLLGMLLMAAMVMPQTMMAQVPLSEYDYATGVDATKWKTLTSPTTISFVSADDGASTSVYNIGFNFDFGEGTYSQFSANTNGNIRLGSTIITGSPYSSPLSSSNISSNLPKIVGIGRDLSVNNSATDGYVKYQLMGTAPNRILVVEFFTAVSSSGSSAIKWQVQLHETTNQVLIVYGTSTSVPSSYQTGIAATATDAVIVNTTNHTFSTTTNGTSTTYSTWPGTNRYYSFTPPSVTCPKPSNIVVSSISTTEATISWTPGGTETQWLLTIDTNNYVVNSSTYNATTLSSGTDYNISVRALCSATDTSRARTSSFTTLCEPVAAFPYTENFESRPEGSASPVCWKGFVNNSTYAHYYLSSSNAYSGQMMFMEGYGSDKYCVLSAPELDASVSLSGLTVSFMARKGNSTDNSRLIVGTTNGNGATFLPIDTVALTNDWTEYEVPLTRYTGANHYVALKCLHGTTSGYYQVYVDDFSIAPTLSCLKPNQVAVDSSTDNTIWLSWNERNGATSWTIAYDTAHITDFTNANTINVSTNPCQISNLMPSTRYYFYVMSGCSSGNSNWSNAGTGLTKMGCAGSATSIEVTTGPRTETTSYAPAYSGWGNTFSQTIYTADELDEMGLYPGHIFKLGYLFTIGTYAKNVKIYMGNTLQEDFTNSASSFIDPNTLTLVYANSSFAPTPNAGDDFELETPFYWDGTSNLVICFIVNSDASSGSTSTTSTSWSTAASTPTTATGHYRTLLRYIDGASGYNLTNYASTGSLVYINAMPDITISSCANVPSCIPPRHLVSSNIGTTTATLSWTQLRGTPTSWNVVYSTSPITNFNNLVTTMVTDTFAVLTNLSPSSTYYAYVQASCGNDGSSPWIGTMFRTGCGTISNYPFYENFDSYEGLTTNTVNTTNHLLPHCWLYQNTGTSASYTGYPYITAASASNCHSEPNCIRFYMSTAATFGEQTAITPAFEDVNRLQISFIAKSGASYANTSRLAVGCVDDTSFVFLDTLSLTATYQEYTVDLDRYTGTGNRIALRGLRSSSGACEIYIDDIMIAPIPTCFRPTDFNVVSATSNSLTLSWTDPNDANRWTLQYDTASFRAGQGRSVIATTNPFTITGLQPSQTYHFLLHANCSGGDTSYNVSGIFRTDCAPLTTLPYSYGFEDCTQAATGTLDICWHKGTSHGTIAYPYPSNNAHSGNNSLLFFSDVTNYSYATLPTFAEDIRNLSLTFWSKTTGTNSGTLRIGVMSDPNDISTFELVQVATPNGTEYTRHTIGFSGYIGQGNYIAILCENTGNNTVYVDDVTVDYAPGCPSVANLVASNVASTAAEIDWTYAIGASSNTPSGYIVEYKDLTTNSAYQTVNNINPPYLVAGLTPSHSYRVRVTALCEGVTGGRDSVEFETSCISGGSVSVGTAANASNYIPFYNGGSSYTYSLTQQLFTADELQGAGTITGIELQFDGTTPVTNKNNVDIYLAHTTQASLTTATYIRSTDMTLVYSGNMNATPGWNTYYFNTPFQYDGTRNLVLVVDDNSATSNATSYKFKASPKSGRTLYIRATSNINPASPGSFSAHSYLNNIHFLRPCDTTVTCNAPLASISNVTNNSIDVTWTPGLYDSTWTVQYRVATASSWTTFANATTQRSASITGLQAATSYQVRIGTLCDSTMLYDTVTAVTNCNNRSIPFTEGFESWTASATYLPSCWNKGTSYSTQFPYVVTDQHRTGNKALQLQFNNTTNYSYIALPLLNAPIDTLLVSFYLYKSTTNSTYRHSVWVGVMTDPTDYTTFTMIQEVAPSAVGVWEGFEVLFNSYHGDGEYIAFMSPQGEYSSPYIDDIMVDYIPSCLRPSNIRVSNITPTTADLSWYSNSSNYDVQYGPSGFTLGQGTTIQVVGATNTTLTNLIPSTDYDIYVRGRCSSSNLSNWSFVKTITTACGTISTVPFTETFDNWGYGTPNYPMPRCWERLTTTANRPYINNGGFTGNYLLFNSGNNGYAIAVLPQINTTALPINQLQVSFKVKRYSNTYTNPIIVGVLSDPTNRYTFTGLDTIYPTSTNWEDAVVPLADYTGRGSYIAFFIGGASTQYGCVDNVEVDLIRECLAPNRLSASNATSNSVVINWHERTLNESRWIIEYGDPGFVAGRGTKVVATTNPYTLTGLPSSYSGEFYVRTVCAPGDTSEYNRNRGSFATMQVPAAVPYYCSFEQNEDESTNWTILNNGAENGWYVGSDCADNGSRSLYISNNGGTTNSYNPNAASVSWVYRDIAFPTIGATDTFKLSITWRNVGESCCDYMRVYICPNLTNVSGGATSSFTPAARSILLSNQYVSNGNMTGHSDWVTSTFKFTSGEIGGGGTKRLYLLWRNDIGTGNQTPAAVDEIIISRPDMECQAPSAASFNISNVRYNTATLTWTAVSDSYEIAYKEALSNQWGDVVPVQGNSYTFTGLDASTAYMFRLRQACGTNGNPNWTSHANDCYSSWSTGTFSTDMMPCFKPTNLIATSPTTSTITLNWDAGSNEPRWKVHVFNGAFDTIVTVSSHPVTVGGLMANTTYRASITALCAIGNRESIGSDTISFRTSYCDPVSMVTVSNITSSTATISWENGSNSNNWEMQFGHLNLGQGEGTSISTTSNPYTLTGLTPATSYDIYVRSNCSNDNYILKSSWSNRVSFTTTGAQGTRYSITTNVNDANMGSVQGGGNFLRGAATTLTAIPNNGYKLGHWQDGNTDNPRVIIVDHDATYTATFTLETFVINAVPNNPRMGDVSGGGYYIYNSTATLTATPAEGYHFVRWQDGNTEPERTISVTGAANYTAFFAADNFTIRVTVDEVTHGVAIGGGEYSYGENVTLQASSSEGYVFSHWQDNNTDNPRTIRALSDETYVATFAAQASPNKTITVQTDRSMGTIIGGGHYLLGNEATITAVPYNGYHFVKWAEKPQARNPYTFTVTTDDTLTAIFAADTFRVSASGMPSSAGRVTGTGNYAKGSVARLRALPEDGYLFSHWMEDNSTDNPRNITVNQDINLTAVFSTSIGIEETIVLSNQQVTISPNPTSGNTTIRIEGIEGKIQLSIIDLSGRKVMGDELECEGDCAKMINVQGLEPGAYFVRVTSSTGNTVKKLIVK